MDKKIIKNIVKGTSVTTFGSLISMGFHFISIFFITRHIAIEEFGIYALVIAVSGLLNLLSSLGLEISIVKFIAEGTEYRNELLKPTLIIKTLATIIIVFLFISLYKFYPTDGDNKVWDYNIYTILLFVLGSYRDFFYRVLQGVNRFRDYTYAQIIGAISRVIIIFVFIFFNDLTLEYLLITEVLTAALAISYQLIKIPFDQLWNKAQSKMHYKYVLKFSAPLFANNIITFAYDKIGIFILGILMTTASVAVFDVASRLPGALQGILSSFIIVFFPNMSTLFNLGDRKNAEELINHSLDFFTMLLSSCTLVIFIWREEIVILLFSAKYIDAAVPLSLFMISLTLRSLANILGYSIVSAGYSKIPMKVNLIAMIIGVVSTYFFVLVWGYIGAVLATILLNLISFIQYLSYVKNLNISTINYKFLSAIISVAAILIILLLINHHNIFLNFVAFLTFIIINRNRFKSIVSLLIPSKIKTYSI